MKAALGLVATVLLLAMAYVAFTNTAAVELVLPRTEPVRLPLGWLLVVTFSAGALIAVVGNLLAHAVRSVGGWSSRRRNRYSGKIQSWIRNGRAHLWNGELDRGRSLLSKAWRKDPSNGTAAAALAESFSFSGEHDAARRILQEAVSHDSHDPDLRCAFGEAVERSGDITEAIRVLETVRIQHPRAVRVLRPLARLYELAGRWDEAARVQQAYLEAAPGARSGGAEQERLAVDRYRAAMANSDPEQRARALTSLLEANRTSLAVVVSAGDALVEAGRPAEAIRLWERHLRERPATVLFQRLIAQHSASRDRQQVIGLLRKLRNVASADTVHALAAELALQTGGIELAAHELESITQQDTPAIHRLWSELYRQRGETERALRSLTRAIDGAGSVTGYDCLACGAHSAEWTGICPSCNRWNTYRSVFELSPR